MSAHEVSVRFPARPGYLYISRLNASAIGTEAGLDVDALEDLRLAVTEMVGWLLLDSDGVGYIELDLIATQGEVTIRGQRTETNNLPDREPGALVSAVFGATLDSHQLVTTGGGRQIEMRKSASSE